MTLEEIFDLSGIDPWFLFQIKQIVDQEKEIRELGPRLLDTGMRTLDHPLRQAKEFGFSDRRLAQLLTTTEEAVRTARVTLGIIPVYKTVDTCAAEFEAHTPYLYSTYEKPFFRSAGPGAAPAAQAQAESESGPTDRRKIVILGGASGRVLNSITAASMRPSP